MMKRTLRTLALGTGLLMAATCMVAASAADQQATFSKVEILSDRSLLTIDADITDQDLVSTLLIQYIENRTGPDGAGGP